MKLEHFSNKWENFPTFSEFIAGTQNNFALESLENTIITRANNIASQEEENLEENPEENFEENLKSSPINFILIKGANISGKTHLLEASAHKMKELAPQSRVLFAQARELIQFFSEQKKYSKKIQELEKLDIFLIDNIHLLASDKECQEQINQLLDILDRNNALVISTYSSTYDFANQTNFNANPTLEQNFYSRISSGLLLNISPPDIDILMRYALRESEKMNLSFTKSMCLTLARFCYDIRQLQGILKTIEGYAKASKFINTDANLTKFLMDFEGKKEVTPDLIISSIAQHFSLQVKDIRGKGRLSQIVQARQMSMYLCRKLLGYSYPRIAQMFGGKDHTTIMYACSKIEKDPISQALAHSLSQRILLESSFASNI